MWPIGVYETAVMSIKLAELPLFQWNYDYRGIILGDRYGYLTNSHLFLCDTSSPLPEKTTIVIEGGFSTSTHLAALDTLPDMNAVAGNKYFFNNEMLVNELLTRNPEVDIYSIDSTFVSLEGVLEKGYAYPFPTDGPLASVAESLYPSLREGLSHNGHLYALPVNLSDVQLGMHVNAMAFEEAGLTYDDAPSTYMEWFAFMIHWAENRDALPSHLIPASVSLDMLYEMVLEEYYYEVYLADDTPSFQEPRLLEHFAMARQAVDALSDAGLISTNDVEKESMTWPSRMFFSLSSKEAAYHDSRILIFDPASPEMNRVAPSVMFINPYSTHKEEAARYLAAYYYGMEPEERMLLSPVDNHEVVYPHYYTSKAHHEKEIALREAAIETVEDPLEAAMLQDSIDYLHMALAELEVEKYAVSNETLAIHQERMAHAEVVTYCQISSSEVKKLIAQCIQGKQAMQNYWQALTKCLH